MSHGIQGASKPKTRQGPFCKAQLLNTGLLSLFFFLARRKTTCHHQTILFESDLTLEVFESTCQLALQVCRFRNELSRGRTEALILTTSSYVIAYGVCQRYRQEVHEMRHRWLSSRLTPQKMHPLCRTRGRVSILRKSIDSSHRCWTWDVLISNTE